MPNSRMSLSAGIARSGKRPDGALLSRKPANGAMPANGSYSSAVLSMGSAVADRLRSPRSIAHMLSVAAERLPAEYGDEATVKNLRAAARAAARGRAEGRGWTPEDQKRVERQRTCLVMVPDSAAKARLERAMLQQAYNFMWDGYCQACDALTEWLSADAVDVMFR